MTVPNRMRIDPHTEVEVRQRYPDGDTVRVVVVRMSRLPGTIDGVSQPAVEHHMAAALRRLLQSGRRRLARGDEEPGMRRRPELHGPVVIERDPTRDRAPGLMTMMRGTLVEYLRTWCRRYRPNAHMEWDVNIPIRFERRCDLQPTTPEDPDRLRVDRANIDVTIEVPPPGPPPGSIDEAYERVDEVVAWLRENCGGSDPMSELIRRWRDPADPLRAEQARFFDQPGAYRYANPVPSDPPNPNQFANDVRILLEERLTSGRTELQSRIDALRALVTDGINGANRYISDELRLWHGGADPDLGLDYDRVVQLRDWIQLQAGTFGTLYNILHRHSGQAGACAWQVVDWDIVLSDRSPYR